MLYYFVGRYGKCQAVYRSASTGFFLAALFAGYNPKITPIATEKSTAIHSFPYSFLVKYPGSSS